jgi:glycosyltransferase involved in cell wall biosynthesis
MKLGFLATHPIQYHAPIYRELAQRDGIDLTVYFCHKPTPEEQGAGFGIPFSWDVDLLSGYRHHFLKNRARRPTVGFYGFDCPEIEELISRERFDWFVVQGWDKKACWQAFRACWRQGTKLAVRSDSPVLPRIAPPVEQIKRVIKRLVYPFFISRFDMCLPYGKLSADLFRYYQAKHVAISPHFVDNAFFSRNMTESLPLRTENRKRWRIADDAFCFIFSGKFQPLKRPLDILNALLLLLQQKETWSSDAKLPHLLMVGDGMMRGECEQFALSRGLPVTFAGFLNQSEISSAYGVSDCLVLASSMPAETWGLVVNEAMACGLPALVSEPCGCTPDLIVNGETGYTFKCHDIPDLASKMSAIMNDKKGWLRMSEGALRHISGFSVERAADKLLEAIGSSSS